MSEYPLFELEGLEFGGDRPVKVSAFSPGSPDVRTQDVENSIGDGAYFGRDYLSAPAWTFDIFTDVHDWAQAHSLAGEIARRWLDPALRDQPGKVVPLRYWMADRWRRVYGRPRRFSGTDGGLLASRGRAELIADFQLAHHLHYDDVEQVATVGTVPASVGGFIFPAVFPLSTAQRTASERSGQFEVGGTAATWPLITIQGPISGATVSVGSWSMRMVGSIAHDQQIVVNTAPWAHSITRGDGAPVAGALHPTAALSDLSLAPGHHELKLEGTDLTGTATATLTWRDAFYEL